MNNEMIMSEVLTEIRNSVLRVPEGEIVKLAEELSGGKRVFCDGMGRSRLQVEGFAMRLTQMGFCSMMVGASTTPAITADDILFICSGSGETPMLVAHAAKAQSIGARIILITTDRESALAKISDEAIIIQASSKNKKTGVPIQPMGSLFEQSVGILCDILVLFIMKRHGINNEAMYRNHSNLE